MRLLIITQKVDARDPVLGFFHRWIEEFAKHCEQIVVIALGVGEYNLPANVKVLSLGKESGSSRFKYVGRLFKYLWQERKNYDTVFVHMNQEYVLLAGWWWRLVGKKIWFWRNHPKGNFLTKLTAMLSNRVFCTSPYSFTANFEKTELMPAGIDTNFFCSDPTVIKEPGCILCLGRISPVKKIEQLITAASILKQNQPDIYHKIKILIVGDALPRDLNYHNDLKQMVEDLDLGEATSFHTGVSNQETKLFYNQAEIYVNMTPSGSLDKTVLEAMACGILTITSNKSFVGQIDNRLIFAENDPVSLAVTICSAFNLGQEEKRKIAAVLMSFVVDNHGLKKMTEMLLNLS
jgi:glycosyltransferase involved in cell wall biosynthesis